MADPVEIKGLEFFPERDFPTLTGEKSHKA
jgi:hypothetical protein